MDPVFPSWALLSTVLDSQSVRNTLVLFAWEIISQAVSHVKNLNDVGFVKRVDIALPSTEVIRPWVESTMESIVKLGNLLCIEVKFAQVHS